jgi:hypothetical protein
MPDLQSNLHWFKLSQEQEDAIMKVLWLKRGEWQDQLRRLTTTKPIPPWENIQEWNQRIETLTANVKTINEIIETLYQVKGT